MHVRPERGKMAHAIPILALVLALAVSPGCGYSLRPPFDKSIRTVYVPVFRSVTFRRDINLMLTESVQKEIERRSHFKVVGTPDGADTTLSGEIFFTEKNTIVENPNNLPRQLNLILTVSVIWEDNRPEFDEDGDPKPKRKPEPVVVSESVFFNPEVGETVTLAYEKACQQLARQIVGMMEEPW